MEGHPDCVGAKAIAYHGAAVALELVFLNWSAPHPREADFR
ncbi:hypothetical protein SBA2_60010 [Acidobacteriia bacterium SbA2]|nr:hypothetical protein SBA2_60010 [Acidobacteriia bacterium SbA2]